MSWARCTRCGVVAPVSCGEGSCTTDVLCDYCLYDISEEQDELVRYPRLKPEACARDGGRPFLPRQLQ
jgi:hypothetical protein